jgi:hypothetical protein
MVRRQKFGKTATSLVLELRDHHPSISVVLLTVTLALEEQLEFRGEVWEAISSPKNCFAPVESHGGFAAIDPPLVAAFSDGHIKHPWASRVPSTPEVVLLEVAIRFGPSPWLEPTSGGQVDVPSRQNRR